MTSALRSLVVITILCARELALIVDLPWGELVCGGVEEGVGVAESRLNIDCWTGTPFKTA
jgi:hypothetical protein